MGQTTFVTIGTSADSSLIFPRVMILRARKRWTREWEHSKSIFCQYNGEFFLFGSKSGPFIGMLWTLWFLNQIRRAVSISWYFGLVFFLKFNLFFWNCSLTASLFFHILEIILCATPNSLNIWEFDSHASSLQIIKFGFFVPNLLVACCWLLQGLYIKTRYYELESLWQNALTNCMDVGINVLSV